MFSDRYKIYKVEPKSGVMRDVHNEVLNSECQITYLELDDPAYIDIFDESDGRWHTLRTSPVVNVDIRLDGKIIAIETKNTLYCFEKI